MFAVPGWSVSADKLKSQQEPTGSSANLPTNGGDSHTAKEGKSKKRKRGHGKTNGINLLTENVADLWEKHIEGRGSKQQPGPDSIPEKSRRRKTRRTDEHDNMSVSENPRDAMRKDGLPSKSDIKPKTFKKPARASTHFSHDLQDGRTKYNERRDEAQQKVQRRKASASSQAPPPNNMTPDRPSALSSQSISSLPPSSTTISIPPPAPSVSSKLTPLQTAMRTKLISARFRHINETLYTTPSTHASSLFSTNPEAFASYHAGFRAQVASWPQNPVELFVQEIKDRGAAKDLESQKQLWKQQKKKGKKDVMKKPTVEANAENGARLDLLPRSSKSSTSTILDLGCGDASLQASLLPYTSSLNVHVQSFDLSKGDGPNAHLITVSDIAHLPLAEGSADVAIFCLALMGTNWVEFVTEAARVVRVGGECWVGEVRSRFVERKEAEKAKAGINVRNNKKKKKEGANADDPELMNGRIEVEEDEIAGKKIKEQETDVGPFLDVFRRRGFALKGDVDTRNKMFLRMRFVRVRNVTVDESVSGRQMKQRSSSKFIDKEDEMAVDPDEEAKVLKPCLYKTR